MKSGSKWLVGEVKFLTEHYQQLSVKEMADALERSEKAIRRKLQKLDIKLADYLIWSQKEIGLLKKNLNMSVVPLSKLFPQRTENSVYYKALQLGRIRAYKGYYYKDGNKYIYDRKTQRYVVDYRILAEEKIGRKLRKGEVVHHINVDHFDNSKKNLFVCKNRSEHSLAHWSMQALAKPLIELGIVYFDEETVEYKISYDHLK